MENLVENAVGNNGPAEPSESMDPGDKAICWFFGLGFAAPMLLLSLSLFVESVGSAFCK